MQYHSFFNKCRTTFILTLILIAISSTGWCATYYVDKSKSNANDSNSGTESSPWKTIQKGVKVAVAGDTVLVKGGTYYEQITGDNSGRAGAPITFKNYGNDVVTVDGSNHSDSRVVNFSNNNYIIWDGLDVRNGSKRGAWFCGNHNIIQNSEFYDNGNPNSTGHTGLDIIDSDNTIVRNNIVYRNGWNGINIEKSNNTTVEYNVSYDNTGHMGIQLFQSYGETGKMWQNNNVRYNIVHNNANGIFSVHQEDNEISNNLIFNNSDDGILLTATNNGISSYEGRTKIFNNTISGNGRYGIGNDSSTHMIIKNNIFANNTKSSINDRKNSSTHQIDYDLYYNNGNVLSAGGGTYSTVSSLSSSKGYEIHGVSGDPLFNNVYNNDYSLKSGSPAINVGADISGVSLDLQGTTRPQSGGFDIGAYEFTGSVVINPPTAFRLVSL